MVEISSGQVASSEIPESYVDRLIGAQFPEESVKPIQEKEEVTTKEEPTEKEPSQPQKEELTGLTFEVDGQRLSGEELKVKIGDKEYSLSELAIDIDGNIVKLPEVKEGYMKEKDYRQKTMAASKVVKSTEEREALVSEREEALARYYGMIKKLESAEEKVLEDLENPDAGVYTRKELYDLVKKGVKDKEVEAETPTQKDLEDAYWDARQVEWKALTLEYPELNDKNSELFKEADAYIHKKGIPWILDDPLNERYAVETTFLALQKRQQSAKKETTQRGVSLDAPKPKIMTGGGGGSDGKETSDDAFAKWFEGLSDEDRQNPYKGVVTRKDIERYESIRFGKVLR